MAKHDRVKMTVELEVTIPQALALQAMFKYWNKLSAIGSSRIAGFFADGDGDFHPDATWTFDHDDMPELTDDMAEASAIGLQETEYLSLHEGDRYYDYDPIAWKLNGED